MFASFFCLFQRGGGGKTFLMLGFDIQKGEVLFMFGFNDLWKFFFSFFLILPVVTLIHEMGHYFFTRIFGGRMEINIGTGKPLMKVGPFRLNRIYFWDGWCEYESLRVENRLTNILVYAGGSIFNLMGILLVNALIYAGVFEASIFTYQFAYFSFYFVFFSLFPIDHPNGYPSDGKAILNVLREGESERNPQD